MWCRHCGAGLTIGQRFCGQCGLPIELACPVCGTEVMGGQRYCGECGAEIRDNQSFAHTLSRPDLGERRLLTVVFVDLVGSTPLSIRLDPEDLRDVITTYQSCVTQVAKTFDGFVAQFVGDGVLVYFGHPKAHEDDADRAVHFGLEMVRAVQRLATAAGPAGTLAVHVGIATGPVVVAAIGTGAAAQVSALGDPPNLAAQLQSVAPPNSVVISDSTRPLTGRLFEYRDLGLLSLKGLPAPLRAWAIVGVGPTESRFEALRHSRRPLVNRENELATMLQLWQAVKLGEGRVIALSGDAGIGKSRVVSAFNDAVANERHVKLHLACSSYHADTPLYPLLRCLEREAGLHRSHPLTAQQAKLEAFVWEHDIPQEDAALFAYLLSMPWRDEEKAAALSPRQRKDRTFVAIAQFVEKQSAKTPLILVFEDLHWADPTTLELVGLLLERIEQLPVMLIATTRPDARLTWASRLNITNMILDGLSHSHSRELIGNVVRDKILPASVVDEIIAHSDGVPLFVEELTASMLETRLQIQSAREDVQGAPLSVEMVPRSLQASLLSRLDRRADLKEITQIASVIGRDFSVRSLQVVSGLEPDKLERALQELVRSDLIFPRGPSAGSGYSFKHALLQDAAYSSLVRQRRRAMHRRLAEALAQREISDIESDPQIIAWHFAEGHVPDRSIEFFLQAADRATGRSALAEMVNHLRNALRQIGSLRDGADKWNLELRIQVQLGRALIDHQGSGSQQVRTAFERALELCLALNNNVELLRTHDGLMNHYITRSQPQEVLRYAREMLNLSRANDNPQNLLMALRSQGFANLMLGRFPLARQDFEELLEVYDAVRDGPGAFLTARDPKVSVCTLLGMCLTAMGYPDAGAARSAEGLQHAGHLDHTVSMVLGLRRACVQSMMQRDVPRALRLSNELLTMDAEHEVFLGTREGGIFHGWARLHQQNDPEVHDQVQMCINQLEAAQHWVMLPFFMACAAERRGFYGDREVADDMLRRALLLVDRTEEVWCLPEILRLQACFSAVNATQARELLDCSLDLAKKQGARLWELRTSVTLATLSGGMGETAQARSRLGQIVGWFTEGFTTVDVAEARLFLEAF
jgi:class 3 adenylate cyclase/tetratricopeptide (TPR) repeat protein